TVQGGGILAGRSGDQVTLASLTLQSGAIVDASLGAPASTNADALFNLSSGLTLDGTLNVSDAGGFGKGTYRLINYDGKLTDNGMSIGTVPSGFSAADMTVQTSVADQVNLVEAPASTGPGGGGDTVQFWDGDTAGNASNGKIDGGDGTWTATSSNWTDVDGTTNGPMSPTPGFAIFESAPGTVTVDDGAGPVAVTDMQFASDGYTVKGGAINLDATNSMLRVGDGTAAGADYTAAVDADINGTGQVTKTDLGTLVLGGTDTWNGTTVQDGTLAVEGQLASDVQVQSGATLSGHGTVKGDVTNTGTVAPGGSVGTLTVDGDYTNSADGVLEADIAPDGSGDLLKVTGKATLQGGTVDVVKATGNYSGDTRYTLVDAAGGVIGTFDTLTQNTPFLNLALGYDADHVYLSVLRNHVSFCDVAGTVNECDTGQGVESTGVANPLYDTIAGLPDTATARAAFDQLSGEFHASQQAARVEDSRFVREAMNRRLREGAADAEADRVPGTRLTAWAHGWGHWGSIDGDGNAAKLSDNGDGLLIGADLPVGKTGRIGVTGGAARNSLSVDARNAWARTTAQWLGVYGGFTQGPFAFRAGAAYAWEQIPAYREVNFPGLSERLSSNAIGDTVTGYVEGAWRIQTAVGEIAPYLNIANVQVHTGRATEVGGTAALHMTSQGMDTSLSTLGVRGHWQLAQRLSLHADLGWQHAFGDTLPERTQWFARGDAFTVYGVPLANNAGLGRLGLSWQAAPNITVAADYEGLWGGGVQDQAAKASLQVKF
ncbi:MAG: autotransporter outer membrane beta-barrel domain-containing protein, partial [Rhodanobacteraceae bacterium]